MPRPNPARDAVTNERLASLINVKIICHLVAFNDTKKSRYSSHNDLIVRCETDAIIGSIIKNCAIIIAIGVNKRLKTPNGPELDNNKYTKSPITTGGSPISAFIRTIMLLLKRKLETANQEPKGIPTREAIRVAVKVTCSDLPEITYKSLSNVKINIRA